MPVFDLDPDGELLTALRQVTVTNLSAEGQALGLGDSITAEVRTPTLEKLSTVPPSWSATPKCSTIAAKANPADRDKITEPASDLKGRLKQSGQRGQRQRHHDDNNRRGSQPSRRRIGGTLTTCQ